MQTIDVARVLRNIIGFSPGPNIEQRHNDLWHWFKHCFGFRADTPHLLTLDEYLRIGREIAAEAARNAPGTYLKLRGNNEILIYWQPIGGRGMFMVVVPFGDAAGHIKTLFSPDDGKRYFDFQEPIEATFH